MSKSLGSNQVEVHGSNFNTFELAMGAMLAQNPIGKYDKPIIGLQIVQ